MSKIKYEKFAGVYRDWEVQLELCSDNGWFWAVKLYNGNRVMQEMSYGSEDDYDAAALAATTYIDEFIEEK